VTSQVRGAPPRVGRLTWWSGCLKNRLSRSLWPLARGAWTYVTGTPTAWVKAPPNRSVAFRIREVSKPQNSAYCSKRKNTAVSPFCYRETARPGAGSSFGRDRCRLNSPAVKPSGSRRRPPLWVIKMPC